MTAKIKKQWYIKHSEQKDAYFLDAKLGTKGDAVVCLPVFTNDITAVKKFPTKEEAQCIMWAFTNDCEVVEYEDSNKPVGA